MKRWQILALGVVVVTLLGILASGLADLSFRGGRSWGSLPPSRESPQAPPPPLNTPENLLKLILFTFLLVSLIGIVLAMTSREWRKRLLRQILFGAALVLTILAITHFVPQVELPEPAEPGPPAPPLGTLPPQEEGSPPPEAPEWATYLVAVLLAAVLVGVGWRWWLRRLRARWVARELHHALQEAVQGLEQGLPVSDVVIQCWVRMVQILSRRVKGLDAPQMTPRELAFYLRSLGFQEQAIERLTALFEEVRYGRKESEPRRAEALAALAAIERSYA